MVRFEVTILASVGGFSVKFGVSGLLIHLWSGPGGYRILLPTEIDISPIWIPPITNEVAN
jgi:hypothetical protein